MNFIEKIEEKQMRERWEKEDEKSERAYMIMCTIVTLMFFIAFFGVIIRKLFS